MDASVGSPVRSPRTLLVNGVSARAQHVHKCSQAARASDIVSPILDNTGMAPPILCHAAPFLLAVFTVHGAPSGTTRPLASTFPKRADNGEKNSERLVFCAAFAPLTSHGFLGPVVAAVLCCSMSSTRIRDHAEEDARHCGIARGVDGRLLVSMMMSIRPCHQR